MIDYNLEKRRFVIGGVAIAIVVIYSIRLFTLQIMSDDYKKNADSNAFLKQIEFPSRGAIYDRNGTILAMSASAETIFLSPKEILENEQDQDLIANGLAEILDMDAEDILKKMEKTTSQYEILVKKADDELAGPEPRHRGILGDELLDLLKI